MIHLTRYWDGKGGLVTEIWCAGEGRSFPVDEFDTTDNGLMHKGHSAVTGDPTSFPPRNGPTGFRPSVEETERDS